MDITKQFPLGERGGDNFVGEVYVYDLFQGQSSSHLHIWNVTFVHHGRTKWHIHKEEQYLLVTYGVGWYVEDGQEPRRIKEGDSIYIPKDVVHWHGAAGEEPFAHIAITVGATEWLDK